MQFLILAILCSSSVSIAMRIGTDRAEHNYGMLTMGYVASMLVAALHAGISDGFASLLPFGRDMVIVLGFGAVAGLVFLGGFVLLQSNMKKNGIVLSSVFMKLGLLVPMVISILFFGELPDMLQIGGFILAVGAIVLINYQKQGHRDYSVLSLILLLLCGGMADAMNKIFEQLGPEGLSAQFLFYTFLWALLICKDVMFFRHQHIGRNEIIYGFLIGIPNFYSSRFLLHALESIDAVIAYPSFSVGTLLLVTMTGVVFFKEKLRNIQWLAVGLILVSLVLLNV